MMKKLAPGLGETLCLKELTGMLKQGYMSLLVIDHFLLVKMARY